VISYLFFPSAGAAVGQAVNQGLFIATLLHNPSFSDYPDWQLQLTCAGLLDLTSLVVEGFRQLSLQFGINRKNLQVTASQGGTSKTWYVV
jgi:hypothetical protein